MVARLRIAPLVRMEISKLHYLADRAAITATGLFAVPEKNRRGAALFRSHTIAAVCNVGVVLWLDCRFAFRHARGTAGFEQTRHSLPRSGSRRDRSIIKPLLSQKPFEVRARFSPRAKRNACPNAAART